MSFAISGNHIATIGGFVGMDPSAKTSSSWAMAPTAPTAPEPLLGPTLSERRERLAQRLRDLDELIASIPLSVSRQPISLFHKIGHEL